MSQHPALAGLRVGCVQYLNARPLIYGYRGPVVFDHPSALAGALAAGALDVALVPIFEALRSPHYRLVDGVAIASAGPVFSVFLAHCGPLKNVRRIALDPASRTSAHLLQILLAEYHGLHPEYVSASELASEPDAQLLIGNQAIEFRACDGGAHQLLDLGAEWQRCTGLPFVFAAWLLRPDLVQPRAVAETLRGLCAEGTAHISEIARAETLGDFEMRERYLTEHIRFQLGPREKAGIEKFRELLVAHHFIVPAAGPLIYV